ncbi:MAG: 30S ribosomal protein S13 [Flavobacteriales bacterium]|jgi:small subunit ribosomal protein S13|uniref:30S ribosomal protein S13 n=1 Tax=Blattabacterium sp. (Mastotermes darwiniensis) TaxID=39768 RepID=UPI000231DE5D|nr:30S ribosomal protein S13 [Blattabacterium sp. (Mastotermes darwiniensis)]AER40657.1 30S ribosomal protein S13 [Blattabacterium sp. (Mastotermes darwiniensis) str. MADAR]MDR1804815.1 30S ribosomal protein S13 [Flavobacteriales bacterium]
MSARISGVDIPKSKRGVIGLTYLYGISKSLSRKILSCVGIDENIKVEDWSDEDISKIRKYISDNIKIEGELRSEIQLSIKRLMDIGCYRGTRHRRGLPLRGQKTKNNCRTRKGRKKTVANKKKTIK